MQQVFFPKRRYIATKLYGFAVWNTIKLLYLCIFISISVKIFMIGNATMISSVLKILQIFDTDKKHTFDTSRHSDIWQPFV